MKVVLDTNVLLMSIPKQSKYRPIFDALLMAKFKIAISNAILEEYLEIISAKTSISIAYNIGELLLQLKNVEQTSVYFRWDLIAADPDDNKFTDCAVSAQADAIVTNDKHFDVLKHIDFPPLTILSADEFLDIIVQV